MSHSHAHSCACSRAYLHAHPMCRHDLHSASTEEIAVFLGAVVALLLVLEIAVVGIRMKVNGIPL